MDTLAYRLGQAPGFSVQWKEHHSVSSPSDPALHHPWQGHAAPILYAVWAEAGFLPEAELLNLRKISSNLDGHPVPVSVQEPYKHLSEVGPGPVKSGARVPNEEPRVLKGRERH